MGRYRGLCDDEERGVRVRWRCGRALWMSDVRLLVGTAQVFSSTALSLATLSRPTAGKGQKRGAGGADPRFRWSRGRYVVFQRCPLYLYAPWATPSPLPFLLCRVTLTACIVPLPVPHTLEG